MKENITKSLNIRFFILLFGELLLLCISSKKILLDGVWNYTITQDAYKQMILECIFIFVCLSALLHLNNKYIRIAGMAMVIAIFLWAHLIFTPVVVVAGYFFVIALLGRALLLNQWEENKLIKNSEWIIYFSLGCIAMVCCFCIASLCKIGNIHNLRILTVVIGIVAFGINLKDRKKIIQNMTSFIEYKGETLTEKLSMSGIITFVLIQFGRANIALDYDSLWYGLRPEYTLNSLTGIYDKLNLQGIVYTYPKGFETLLLPISGTCSYGYIYAANICFLVVILVVAYQILKLYIEKKDAMLLVLLLSGIPGIVNMSVTAKTDISTLFFQLGAVLIFLLFIKFPSITLLVVNVSMLVFSYTLKSTSYMFSSLVLMIEGVYVLYCCVKSKKIIWESKGRNIIIGLICTITVMLLTLRTYWLTGMPFNICTGILEKLGFQFKSPYGHMAGSNINTALLSVTSLREKMFIVLQRLYNFFILPITEDMDHVIIAWGGITIAVCVVVFIISLTTLRVSKERKNLFLIVVTAAMAVSTIGLVVIFGKPDGNCFVFFYALIVCCAGIMAFQNWKRLQVQMLIVPLVLVNIVLASATSWAWSTGFTPISMKHKGYYNHEAAFEQQMKRQGKKIWKEMTSSSENRILTIGEHPKLLRIPAVTNGDIDITVWGNADIFSDLEHFVDYLQTTEIDYIYIQRNIFEERPYLQGIIESFINTGEYDNIIHEKGNTLIIL